jgi:hypothetical protein
MLATMRALILLLLWPAIAIAETPREAVEALPEIATVKQGRVTVVVRGAIVKAKQQEMVTLVEQVIRDTTARFGIAKGDPHPAVTLCLFGDAASYAKVAGKFGPLPSEWGFYLPGKRIAFANIGVSIGNLRHELAHPMIDDDYPKIPAWLGEGVGSLYGSARWKRDKFEFLVNYRLRDVQKALRDNTLPTFAELAASTSRQVHGDAGMIYYGMARYVLLYAEHKGKLAQLYRELRDADSKDHAKVLAKHVDERAFLSWVKALRY